MRLRNALWFFIVLIGILIFISFIPAAPWKARRISKRVICGTKLKDLTGALIVYTNNSDGHFPLSDEWCDLLMQEEHLSEGCFHCPLTSKESFGYAINKYVYEIEPNHLTSPVVLLFEADLGRNGIGSREDMVLRHEGCNVSFTDGRTIYVHEDEIDDLQWTPE